MAAVQSVQVQRAGVIRGDELGPDVVLWEAVVHTQILDPGRKPLIQPQVGPPLLHRRTQAALAHSCTSSLCGELIWAV